MGAPLSHAPSSSNLAGDWPSAGAVLSGRYRLVEPCGSGAMGSVWRARHVELGTSAAIKFLHPEIADTKEGRSRFEREARLSARLAEKSRYIAKVIDYGVVEGRGPFLAMEMLEGEELAERLKRDKRIPLALVAVIVQQLCRALDVAHRAGIVHRDVKPQNVFLARPQTNMTVFVKLMDFGVAKLMESDKQVEGLTRVGMVVGTPAYMSPEQLLAQPVDARSDLWSVAALVYRVVTGDLPFGSGTLAEMGVRIVTLDPRPPSEIVPGLSPAFDAWMKKGLEKAASDRFQSAQELADSLLEIAGTEAMPFALHPSPMADSGLRLADLGPLTPEPVTRKEGKPALAPSFGSGVREVRRPWRAFLALAIIAAGALAAISVIPSPTLVSALPDGLSVPAPVLAPAPSVVVPEPVASPSASASTPPKRPKPKAKFAK